MSAAGAWLRLMECWDHLDGLSLQQRRRRRQHVAISELLAPAALCRQTTGVQPRQWTHQQFDRPAIGLDSLRKQ